MSIIDQIKELLKGNEPESLDSEASVKIKDELHTPDQRAAISNIYLQTPDLNANKDGSLGASMNSNKDEVLPQTEEYEIVEKEILPEKIICPDCGGITLAGLDFCDKCGGELINNDN